MRAMLKGEKAFFYHSNCKVPGIAGIMEIVEEHTPDGKSLQLKASSYPFLSCTGNSAQSERLTFRFYVARLVLI